MLLPLVRDEHPQALAVLQLGLNGGRPVKAVLADALAGKALTPGDWKLLEYFEDNHVELYNLRNDLGEKHDLASEIPGKANDLRQQLQAWRESVGAALPTPNLDFRPGKPGAKRAAGAP